MQIIEHWTRSICITHACPLAPSAITSDMLYAGSRLFFSVRNVPQITANTCIIVSCHVRHFSGTVLVSLARCVTRARELMPLIKNSLIIIIFIRFYAVVCQAKSKIFCAKCTKILPCRFDCMSARVFVLCFFFRAALLALIFLNDVLFCEHIHCARTMLLVAHTNEHTSEPQLYLNSRPYIYKL